jgi:outer membrane receptor protein involved in Fe transport
VVDTSLPSRPNVRHVRVTQGNLNLVPEKADTTSYGLVYRPSWLSQFSASVDFYSIKIAGAIGTLTSQQTVDRCVAGDAALCALITRDAGGNITQILGVPININQQTVRGVDYELSFNRQVGPGQVRIRALATNVLDNYSINNNVKDEALGEAGSRAWRYRLNAGYFWPRLSLSGTLRGFNDGVYDASWHSGVEIDNNRIRGTSYVDLAGTYRILDGGDRPKLTGFLVVENLFDRAPAVVGGPNLANLQTDTLLYDTIGRTMRVGIRYEY